MAQYDDVAQNYHRLIAPRYVPIVQALVWRLPDLTGRDVLEVGAGTGLLTALIAARGGFRSFTATDISAPMLEVARGCTQGSVKFAVADLLALPVSAGSCDVVVSSLTPLSDTVEGFAESRRVLRPDGRLILSQWGDDYAELRLLAEVRKQMRLEPYPASRRAPAIARAEKAGFTILGADDHVYQVRHDSVEAYFSYRLSFGRPSFIPETRVSEFHDTLRRVITAWAQPDGSVVLDWAITILSLRT